MDLERLGYLCDTATRLDYTVPNSKNISRNLREICATRFCRFRLEDVLGGSELCPVCFTPWSSGRMFLRLRSCSKAVKKKSLAKLLRKKPSCLNRYQKALLDRMRQRADNVMRLTCLECKRVTKEYLTKPASLGPTSLLDETTRLDNLPIVTPDKPLVKKKKKKRKKDVMCGLKSSVVAKVRQSKTKDLNTSLKADCDPQVLNSGKNNRCISERESNILTNSSNSREFFYSYKKLRVDDNDSDLSQNVNLKITFQENEKCIDQIKIQKINVHFEQNNFKSDAMVMSEANVQSNVSSSLLKLKKSESQVDHLLKNLTDAPLNAEQETEYNATNYSFCNAASQTIEATHCKHQINENKQFKHNSGVTYDSYQKLESKSKPLASVSDEKNERESCVAVHHKECTSDQMNKSALSDLNNHGEELNKIANNIKINLLSQPSLNNKLQSNVCINLNKNKIQSNDLPSRHLNGKHRSNVDANVINNNKNRDTRRNNGKQFCLPSNNKKPTKHKNSKDKKPTNYRLLNKGKNSDKVFDELTCRNSLCVKDLLTLT